MERMRRGATFCLTASLAVVAMLVLAAGASAATFTINSGGDLPDFANDASCDVDNVTAGDQCTVRAAIEQSNNNGATLDLIDTTFTGTTVTILTALPTLTQPVILQLGETAGHPNIGLDGPGFASAVEGLVLTAGASNSTIDGIAIFDF